jgi:hypothetical protein
VSVGSDDISRETLRIARHGLAARISRVVPFSLRVFPKRADSCRDSHLSRRLSLAAARAVRQCDQEQRVRVAPVIRSTHAGTVAVLAVVCRSDDR